MNGWCLAMSDIYRDGGSYGAAVTDGERVLSYLLRVRSWDHPADRTYDRLFVSVGHDPAARERALNASELASALRTLRGVDVSGASDESRGRFAEMLEALALLCGDTR